jgi:hypothetical protein
MGETLARDGDSASNLDSAAECFLLALASPSSASRAHRTHSTERYHRTRQNQHQHREQHPSRLVEASCSGCGDPTQTLQPEELMWYAGDDGRPRSVHLRAGNLLAAVRRFAHAAKVFRTGMTLCPPPEEGERSEAAHWLAPHRPSQP